MENITKALYLFGAVFLLMSLMFNIYSSWPRMPWDINIQKPSFSLYIPILSAIILSVILTILINLI